MTTTIQVTKDHPDDNSGKLFDHLRKTFKLPTDRAMADHFGLNRATVSRVRSGKAELSDSSLYRISSGSGLTPEQMRKMIGSKK